MARAANFDGYLCIVRSAIRYGSDEKYFLTHFFRWRQEIARRSISQQKYINWRAAIPAQIYSSITSRNIKNWLLENEISFAMRTSNLRVVDRQWNAILNPPQHSSLPLPLPGIRNANDSINYFLLSLMFHCAQSAVLSHAYRTMKYHFPSPLFSTHFYCCNCSLSHSNPPQNSIDFSTQLSLSMLIKLINFCVLLSSLDAAALTTVRNIKSAFNCNQTTLACCAGSARNVLSCYLYRRHEKAWMWLNHVQLQF